MQIHPAYHPARAWIIVGLFCLLFMASFVDRMILALLANEVSQDIGITDRQIGLLVGFGFATLYVIIGFPAAHFVDAGYRRFILVTGVLVWSMATICSGFVESYAALLVAWAFVAAGEAVLTPVAISLIADMFPLKRRAIATSIYMGTAMLMGAGSFVLGGAALELAHVLAPQFGLDSWRLTFVIVGLPGLILGPLTAALMRPASPSTPTSSQGTVAAALQYIRCHGHIFLPVFIGVGVMNSLNFGLIVWMPSVLIRDHGLATAEAGILFGLTGAGAAVAGTLASPQLAQWLMKTGREDAFSIVASGLAVLTALSISTVIALPDLHVVLAGLALGIFGLAGMTVMPAIIIQLYAKPNMRARLMALNLFFTNILGLGLGPVVVAELASHLDVANPIASAIRIFAIVTSICGLGCFLYMRSKFTNVVFQD